MQSLKKTLFIIAATLGGTLIGASAQACSGSAASVSTFGNRNGVAIASSGACDTTTVDQRGDNNGATIAVIGLRNNTLVTQLGRNQSINIRVSGYNNRSNIFSGICPYRSTRSLNLVGNNRSGVVVLNCN